MKSLLLIDGDEYLFKASIAVQRVIKWDDQNHVVYANENEAFDNFARMVQQTQVRLDAEHSVICFGGERPYFREDLWPDYKSDRGTKPICYAAVRMMIQRSYQTKSYPHIEADDCLGILGTKPPPIDDMRYIMCSQDKDMLTVPGWHYDGKGDRAVFIPPLEARDNHYLQTLVGDRTDNYPGCPGLGDKRARAWLEDGRADLSINYGEPWSWQRVVTAFERHELTANDALLMGRLARILQWSDWDYEKKEPILWVPGKG